MKPCPTCGRARNRGATSAIGETVRCLVCKVAAAMKTLRYRPLYAPERRGPRRKPATERPA